MPIIKIPISRSPLYWFFLSLIFIINIFIHYPALKQVARADQIDFLIETADLTSPIDLINYTYSYCRSRLVDTGDEILFRPLFYVLLSLQKGFWGLKFIYWQALCIGLHLIVVAQLLKVLWRIRPGFWAGMMTLAFSVAFISQEQAVWHHMSGYTLALSFILAALDRVLRYTDDRQENTKHLWFIVLYLTIACFIYEYAVVAAVLIFAFIFIHRKFILSDRRLLYKEKPLADRIINSPWLLWIAPIFYGYVSYLDYSLRHLIASEKAFSISILDTVYSLCQLIAFGFTAWLAPSFLRVVMTERMAINSFRLQESFQVMSEFPFWQAMNIVMVCVFAGAVLIVLKTLYKNRKDFSWQNESQKTFGLFGLMCVGLAIGYLMMVLVGRVSARSLTYMTNSLYHYYFVLIFFFIGFYCLGAVIQKVLRHLSPLARSFIILFFCLSILINGFYNWQFNIKTKERYADLYPLFLGLEDLIAKHKNEKDFSFSFIWSDVVMMGRFSIGHPTLGQQKQGELIELIYRKYINKENPKYFVVYFISQEVKVFTDIEQGIQYLQGEFKRQGRNDLTVKKKILIN